MWRAPERSGLYYLHAKGESGAFFSFPWVVAPAEPSADIAVLMSDINWNAYNNFGGRSNYIHPDRLPPTPTTNARLELKRYTDSTHTNYHTESYLPISFDRPELINHVPEDVQVTDPIEGRAACHVAPTEWRILGWLEREGLGYDCYSETQLHFGGLNLDDYKVLILGPHPEYWSKEMYFELKSWVFERGGRLLYLGGNGLNCEVAFPDDSRMVVHNEDGQKLQALGTESRFAARTRIGSEPPWCPVHEDGDHDERAVSGDRCGSLGVRGNGAEERRSVRSGMPARADSGWCVGSRD